MMNVNISAIPTSLSLVCWTLLEICKYSLPVLKKEQQNEVKTRLLQAYMPFKVRVSKLEYRESEVVAIQGYRVNNTIQDSFRSCSSNSSGKIGRLWMDQIIHVH